MDSELSSLTTLVLDTRAAQNQAEAMEHLLPDRLGALAGRARQMIHRCHVADPAFDADDAVQDALLRFWKAVRDGSIPAIRTDEELLKLLVHKLKQVVLNERTREETSKRGGSSFCRVDADFGAIEPPGMSPEDQVIAEDWLESLLKCLHRHDPLLAAIANELSNGFTHREVAAQLGLPPRSVKYRLGLIKAILAWRGSETQ